MTFFFLLTLKSRLHETLWQGDHDCLLLCVQLEARLAELTAVAGHLEAAEGLRRVEGVVRVHPDGAGLDARGVLEGRREVLREDAGGESVVGLVGALDGLVEAVELHHGGDRAEDLLLGDGHVVIDVCKDRGADEVAGAVDSGAAGLDVGTLTLSDLDVAHDAAVLLIADLGAHAHVLETIALSASLRGGGELLHEHVVDALVHEDTARRRADLTLVEKDAHLRRSNCVVDVSIGTDDKGRLAAELEGDTLQVALGGELHHDLADLSRAREGTLVNVHVGGQGSARGGAVAGHNVDDAGGVAGLVHKLGEAQGGERRLLGGLKDDAAAARERGRKLPRGHQEREVPGDDLADDAEGLATHDREEVAVDGVGLALNLVGPAGVVAEALDSECDVNVEGLAEGLSVVKGLERRQLLLVLLDKISQAKHQVAALRAVHELPLLLESTASRTHGDVDVGLVTLGDVADLLAGGGVHDRELLARDGVDEATVDEHLRVEGGLATRGVASGRLDTLRNAVAHFLM
eukprot:PhM_4_TR3439/c0_g1_i2/m.94172